MKKWILLLALLSASTNATVITYEWDAKLNSPVTSEETGIGGHTISVEDNMFLDFWVEIRGKRYNSDPFQFHAGSYDADEMDWYASTNLYDDNGALAGRYTTYGLWSSADYLENPIMVFVDDPRRISDNVNGTNHHQISIGTEYWYLGTYNHRIVSAAVPEPSTLALFGLGLAAFGRKRRKS